MAEEEQNRSEAPSAHKLMHARRKGQVARGLDLSFLSGLAAFLLFMSAAGGALGTRLSIAMHDTLVGGAQLAGDRDTIYAAIALIGGAAVRSIALLAILIFAMVLALELVQTGFVFSSEPLKPDFSRLSPAKGLKRLLSVRLLVETAKNLLKLVAYTLIAGLVVQSTLRADLAGVGDAATLAHAITHSATRLLATVAAAAFGFVVLDQIVTRRDFIKRMRMSRREMKQEARDREGEPRLKQKRKQMHAEFVRGSRSLRGLPGADLLIVNPRHIAVALRYDRQAMTAPLVVSAGVDHLALRLKRLAFVYGIPVIEDRLLARALFRSTAIDRMIPAASFRPVAAIYNRLRPFREAKGA